LNKPHDAGKAAMQQIADWLNQLGMSEYAQRFAENGIDVSVLRDLTNQELRQSAYCSPSPKDAARLANLVRRRSLPRANADS
jgi:hypothetical protein